MDIFSPLPPRRPLLGVAVAVLLAWWCSLLPARTAAAQGVLEALRESVRHVDPPSAESDDDEERERKRKRRRRRKRNDSWWDDDDCDDDDESSIWEPIGMLVGGAVTSPFWAPAVALDDHYDRCGYFPKHPYEDSIDGYMMIDPWVPAQPYTWGTRFSVEYLDEFNDLSMINGKLLLSTSYRLGIDSEVSYRQEDLGPGLRDSLWVGDLNVVFRLAQSEQWMVRSGIGVNWLADDQDENFGFNWTYGVDYFPRRPWVFSTELDWGRLGDSALFHLRSTVGAQFHGVEAYLGCDYVDIGPADTVSLISGIRIWF